ncbi:hypothetical protein [Pyxidicoccus xibeiensis]|uniref:hypothetical protein n=1 Tax=Pyxidicoccus xibeiensis TaxID=2906759 RepID=UPI0020A7B1D5|nr:hypothetical protein [Pyxidicoccus xibeiensis]MCP3143844.1 hypothetical protein [Pyxidicoccus xibeiensis]
MRVVSRLAVLPQLLALCLCLLGAQALAGYAPAPDGYVLISLETQDRHLVAGGAKFFIPSAQWGLYSSHPTMTLPKATVDAVTRLPWDGTLLRQHGYAAVYVAMGGMFWYIQSPAELAYWGNWDTINNIPNHSWQDPFQDYNNKALVRERSTNEVYLWIAGAKFLITNPSDLVFYGGESSVKSVPLGALANITNAPWCGAVLQERSDSTAYLFGYRNTPTIARTAKPWTPHGFVPDGALAPFPVISGVYDCIG